MQGDAQVAGGVGLGGSAKFMPSYNPHGKVAAGIGHNLNGVQLQHLDGDGKR